jgi:hypothetical protein
MRKTLLLAAVVAAIAASAIATPAADVDWNSPDIFTVDADEIELLPPGDWCLVLSVRNNRGEPRSLVYQRGTDCPPEDRVVVEEAHRRPRRGD